MKKLLFTTSILLSAVILTACSNNETATKSSQAKTERTSQTTAKSSKKTATSIDDFKQKLKTNGFTIEREQEKSASLVQAKEGKGFVLSDGSSVEVYQYESNNPYFSKIKEDKKLLDQPVTIYGKFVVMIVNPTDSKNKILDSFKDFE
ncbi:hypothetical protein [Streptococcus constellatus]|uniref:hypothetical protein n=1 Tax=Streptococcus constellatus TaxID=76860 RepID=UPI00066CDC29|nr:hypothetical protein [Streptococcus constellatus]